MKWTRKEKVILRKLQKLKLSPSHEFDHLKRVARFCFDLAKKYSAKREIVVAAALLHDLARSSTKYRGAKSAIVGAKLAKPILAKCGYSEEEIKLISQCIAEHDQPKLKSALLEARILKDADFLDGFGARGILRGIMYVGETGPTSHKATRGSKVVEEVIRRLRDTGRERLEGLEFEESKRLAWKLHRLTEVFLDELGKLESLESISYPGKFVVIEGISGSGKDVQAKLLAKYLQKKRVKVRVVNHPTPFLKKLWWEWRTQVDDRFSEFCLMLADRARMVKAEILPALQRGEVVISTRSSISAQVYQQVPGYPASFYRYCFAFEPVADLVIFLNVGASEALKRTDMRVKKGMEKDRGFFGTKQERQRRLYRKILKNYPNVVRVNANRDIKTVAKDIQRVIVKKILTTKY